MTTFLLLWEMYEKPQLQTISLLRQKRSTNNRAQISKPINCRLQATGTLLFVSRSVCNNYSVWSFLFYIMWCFNSAPNSKRVQVPRLLTFSMAKTKHGSIINNKKKAVSKDELNVSNSDQEATNDVWTHVQSLGGSKVWNEFYDYSS